MIFEHNGNVWMDVWLGTDGVAETQTGLRVRSIHAELSVYWKQRNVWVRLR